MDVDTAFRVLGNATEFKEDTSADDILKKSGKIEEIDSKLSAEYVLGKNKMVCGDPLDCDLIRQWYAKEVLNVSDWKKATVGQ